MIPPEFTLYYFVSDIVVEQKYLSLYYLAYAWKLAKVKILEYSKLLII